MIHAVGDELFQILDHLHGVLCKAEVYVLCEIIRFNNIQAVV